MVEIAGGATNGPFAGATRVYTTYEELQALADSLRGFPGDLSDKVEFEAGKPGGYSYFGIRFYCYDKVGHTAVQVRVEANVATNFRTEEKHTSVLEILFETASLDRFAAQMGHLAAVKSGRAILDGIEPYTMNVQQKPGA